MGARSRTTFKKRQKEIARMEKQRDKAAKRMERRQALKARLPDVSAPEELSASSTEPPETADSGHDQDV